MEHPVISELAQAHIRCLNNDVNYNYDYSDDGIDDSEDDYDNARDYVYGDVSEHDDDIDDDIDDSYGDDDNIDGGDYVYAIDYGDASQELQLQYTSIKEHLQGIGMDILSIDREYSQ